MTVEIRVQETHTTTHDIIGFLVGAKDLAHEQWVDITRNEEHEVINVTIDNDKSLTPLDLEILKRLIKEGKI